MQGPAQVTSQLRVNRPPEFRLTAGRAGPRGELLPSACDFWGFRLSACSLVNTDEPSVAIAGAGMCWRGFFSKSLFGDGWSLILGVKHS